MKMTSKKYEAGKGGINLTISDAWVDFLGLNSTPVKRQRPENYLTLFGDNKKLFLDLWGKQDCCWTGHNRWYIWSHQLTEGTLLCMASTKGCTYEIIVDDNYLSENFEKCSTEALDFLKKVFELK